jgi:hypothetical protein
MRAEARLSHDDACVLSTSEDGRVVAWDIVQAVMLRQFKVRAAACFALPSHFIRFFCVCALGVQHRRKWNRHSTLANV